MTSHPKLPDIVERIDSALGLLDPSIKYGGTMTDLHLLRACKAEIERLRSPAPAEALVDTASDIDRARREGCAQGMKDTLKNIQSVGKIHVSVKCEVCPHEDGCLRCERDGECVVVHRVGVAVPAEDGLREALEHVRAIIVEGAMTGFNPHDGTWAERLFASQAITKAALSSGRDGKR